MRTNKDICAYRVLTSLIKAPIELNRVTICALPVHESVTVITGHENAKNSSNDAKRWPQDLSYLLSIIRIRQKEKKKPVPCYVVDLEVPNVGRVDLDFMLIHSLHGEIER